MMKIKSRPLNKNEIFCCNKKDVKNLFKGLDIDIDFGYYSRDYFQDNRNHSKKSFQGKIICKLSISNTMGQIGADGSKRASLSFYALSQKDLQFDVLETFKNKFLPELFELYSKYKNSPMQLISGVQEIVVELNANMLVIHKYFYHL